MFTTACEAVSTNCCLGGASASMCRLPSNANQTNSPVTAAATTAVASAMVTTSVRFGCLRGGGASLPARTLTGGGTSTLTPAADGAVLFVGPAALDARRLTGFDAVGVETVSSAIMPAL